MTIHPFRRRPRPLPEVEARLASLDDELALTAVMTGALARQGYTRAVGAIVDEQRLRLAAAERAMLRALATRRRRRVHAALSGMAAVLVLASGSVAAVRMLTPASPERLIRQAESSLDRAGSAADARALEALMDEAHRSILRISADDLADPQVREDVIELLDRGVDIALAHPVAAPDLLAKVAKVARTIAVPVPVAVEVEEPKDAPAPPEAPAP